jgi:hypothetical protein
MKYFFLFLFTVNAFAQFTPFPAQVPPVTINSLTEKVTPVGNDELLLSDSENSNASKKVKISSLPVPPALDINGLTEKVTPIDDDVLVIEDSADSFNKKKLKISSLPSGGGGGGGSFPRPDGYAELYRQFYQVGNLTSGSSDGEINYSLSGTGSSIAGILSSTIAPFGGANMNTGTTTTGLAQIEGPNNLVPGFDAVVLEARVGVPTLSDGTNRYQVFIGHSNGAGSYNDSAATYGVYFLYSDNINGGRWEAVTKNTTSNVTRVDTGVSVSAGNAYVLKIEIDYGSPEAKFYINGSLVATITTNIVHPSSPAFSRYRNRIIKIAGTTNRNMIMDYMYFKGLVPY